jgi:hypothetical protein
LYLEPFIGLRLLEQRFGDPDGFRMEAVGNTDNPGLIRIAADTGP